MIRLCLLSALVLALVGGSQACQAGVVTYTTNLLGANEVPPNASPGTGHVLVEFDLAAHTMRVVATFSGLLGNTSAAHIHSPGPPGVNAMVATQVPTFAGFPLGVMAGTYDMTFDTSLASTWNPAFITAHGGTVAGTEAFFASSLDAGTAYFNLHTNLFPGGEIRGNLQVTPEPSTLLLLASGAVALVVGRRRWRKEAASKAAT